MISLRKLLTAGGLAAGVLTVSLAADTPTAFAQPPKKDKKDGPGPKDGPKEKAGPKHIADLRKAYDILADVRPAPKKGGPREEEGRRLFDSAKRLYRDAVAAADGDGPPNPEQSAAAHDAARGLKHWISASQTPVPDLPKPPAPPAGPMGDDPWEPARGELRRAKDRLEDATAEGGPIGKEFLDAAKKAYADGRAAYEAKEYDRAADLARAAEAWSHVGEHLGRAADRRDGPDGKAPPPQPERPAGKTPPPPPDGKTPLPPPERRPDAKTPGKETPPAPPPLGEKEPRERPPAPRP
ncbi:hypothetical protein [Limnoglobus roseus]|uniref:Uncharacterized protein n=1 Tax=Limnoglobus roseus TaxID=2598579 RepID=A0A5C1AII4_9BACT|nr:hypothetical protein [Limnoglobus roseus]QEL17492.1 hypothetical protein PX52LOC_04481 [Limnoglobus roseus]